MIVRALLAIVFFACSCIPATAEELQVRYQVIDMLRSENSRVEVWNIRQVEKSNEVFYELTKEAFAKTPLRAKEVYKRWTRETVYSGEDTYYREFLTTHPMDMDPGDTSFGYLEYRKIATNELLGNWPMFYEIEQEVGGLCATFRIFFSDGLEMKIVREYEKSEMYPLPMKESRITTFGGEVIGHVIYAREE